MNRIEFMTELAALLQDIPEYERVDAMKYYNDYFDDAGEENEQEVIAELESPQKVAVNIKADLGDRVTESGEYTETGYQDARFDDRKMPAGRENEEQKCENEYHYQDNGTSYEQKKESSSPRTSKTLKIILIIAILVIAAPIIITIAIGIAAAVLGILAAVFCVFIAIVVVCVAIAVIGIVLVCSGIMSMIPEIAVGLALLGTGLILTVIGIIGTVAGVRLCMIVFPGIVRGIVWICRWPFHRKAVA